MSRKTRLGTFFLRTFVYRPKRRFKVWPPALKKEKKEKKKLDWTRDERDPLAFNPETLGCLSLSLSLSPLTVASRGPSPKGTILARCILACFDCLTHCPTFLNCQCFCRLTKLHKKQEEQEFMKIKEEKSGTPETIELRALGMLCAPVANNK